MDNSVQEQEGADLERYFAVEANNRAWALSVRPRDADEDEEMLHAAHAAAWHWKSVGSEINWMRALMLLAEVHALLGHGELALAYARRMHDYFTSRQSPDWEIAFAESVLAHAAGVAGDKTLHRSAYGNALRAIDAIVDPEERRLVEETFRQVPAPN